MRRVAEVQGRRSQGTLWWLSRDSLIHGAKHGNGGRGGQLRFECACTFGPSYSSLAESNSGPLPTKTTVPDTPGARLSAGCGTPR